MRLILTAIIICISLVAIAQSSDGNKNMKVEMTREAFYPQGDQALYTYIFHQLQYSEGAKAAKVSGEVMLTFYVEKDSSLADIKVLSDVGFGVGDNLIVLLKKIKYVPALINGTPMRSKVILNVPVRAR